MTLRARTSRAFILASLLALPPAALRAQGELVGRVLEDSSRMPIAGATVTSSSLGKTARTDSLGRFRIADIPVGDHMLQVRALGFRERQTEVSIESNEIIVRDITLVRQAQQLAGATITAAGVTPAKHVGFFERKDRGIGHFITREQLADAEGRRRTGDLIALLPGAAVKRAGMKAWVASSRATNQRGGGCAFCRGGGVSLADRAVGAPSACYMDVYLDGALVFDSTQPGSGLFDVNTLDAAQLEGIEVYAGVSQIPAQYNRTAHGCGVILLWTR